MAKSRVFVFAVLWTVSMLGVGLWAQGMVGQGGQVFVTGDPAITGADIGFQPDGAVARDGTISGQWLVRVNGTWRATSSPPAVRQLHAR